MLLTPDAGAGQSQASTVVCDVNYGTHDVTAQHDVTGDDSVFDQELQPSSSPSLLYNNDYRRDADRRRSRENRQSVQSYRHMSDPDDPALILANILTDARQTGDRDRLLSGPSTRL